MRNTIKTNTYSKNYFFVGNFFVSILLCFALLIANAQTSNALELSKTYVQKTIVAELYRVPVKFNLTIVNDAGEDKIRIFTLLPILMFPNEEITLPANSAKTITVTAYVKQRKPGKFTYSYYIKSQNKGLIKDSFTVEIVPIEEALEVVLPDSISVNDKQVNITIKNNKAINFGNITISCHGLLEFDETITLKAKEEKTILVNVSQSIHKVLAGLNEVNITLNINNEQITIKKLVNVEAYESIDETTQETQRFLLRRRIVTKTNTGNKEVIATIVMRFKPIERAFTSFNIKPDKSLRENNWQIFSWQKTLQPGESFSVVATTNYAWIFIVLIVIAGIAIALRQIKEREIEIIKKVKKLKTKQAYFAIKVVINIKNRKDKLTDVKLVDELPEVMQVYESDKLEITLPHEQKQGKLIWNLGEMEKGEERIIEYIAYSKVRLIGKIELPQAILQFKVKGKPRAVKSERVYIVEEE